MYSRLGIIGLRARAAFTLIEILVVVAIIALLVSILLPSLTRARNQAKIVVCRAREEQLGKAALIYAQSYREYFPITTDSGSDSFYALWKGRLLPDLNVLIDPATKNVIRSQTIKWPEAYDKKDKNGVVIPYQKDPVTGKSSDICSTSSYRDDSTGGHSYEYNGCYDQSSKPWPLQGQHKKVTQFMAFQAKIALINDKDENAANALFGGDLAKASEGCLPSRANNGNNCPQPWDNHGAEGTNVLFGDGHGEWVRKMEGDYIDLTALGPEDSISLGSPKHSKSALFDMVGCRSSHPWNYFRR